MDTTDYKRNFKNLLNSETENVELARQIGTGANSCEEIQQAWLQAESGLAPGQKILSGFLNKDFQFEMSKQRL